MRSGHAHSDKLTDKERLRILSEYDLLPRNAKTGQIANGYLRDLARKWNVGVALVVDIVKARGDNNA